MTYQVQRTIALLEPIYFAILSSILQSAVLLMDETPVKAGHGPPGEMKKGYFWPIYGDKDEIAFPFATSRAEKVVCEVLGSYCGVLLTDSYKVYEKYCSKVPGVVHAQCWAPAMQLAGGWEGLVPLEEASQFDVSGINKISRKQEQRTLIGYVLVSCFFGQAPQTRNRSPLDADYAHGRAA